jgi:hypothetical protein
MESSGGERPTQLEIQIPDEMEAGVYANALGVWHSAYEFTLDFVVNLPPRSPADPEDSESPTVVPQRVVARVKVPPTQIFNIIRALNENMTNYEDLFGPIRRPEENINEGQGDAGNE